MNEGVRFYVHSVVDSAGILVNPENISEYSEALNKALHSEWGNKPRLQAERFSWDNIGEKYLELIDKF